MLEKRVTIKDVAADAGVSISIVSYVLNDSKKVSISEKTKNKVLQSAKKLGYVQNKNAAILRSGRSYNIGVVSYWENCLAYSNFIEGIKSANAQAGYKTLIFSADDASDIDDYIAYYRDHMIDGIIFLTPYRTNTKYNFEKYVNAMNELDIKFSMINEISGDNNVNSFPIDYFRCTYIATRHFVEKGHKDITYVSLFNERQGLQERLDGYNQAVGEAGLKPLYCSIDDIPKKIGDFHAVVTDKTDTAHKVLVAAQRAGYNVPDDFEVIAGNTEYFSRYLYPSVSSVWVPAEEIGALAAKSVIMQINGIEPPKTTPLNYHIAFRDSTKND